MTTVPDRATDSTPTPGPAPPARRADWPRAWAALRTLMRDPERTEKAFEILEAVGGTTDERTYARFLREPEGRDLLREQPSLVRAMADHDALAAMPEGSFGRAYLEFAQRNGFAADGLVALAESTFAAERATFDDAQRWFFDRLNAMHDLWHVLTGYGTDPLGEGALLAFTRAQGVANRGVLVLLAAAMLRGGPGVARALWTGHRRGRRAEALLLVRFEALLPLPLEVVRARLAIEPLAEAA